MLQLLHFFAHWKFQDLCPIIFFPFYDPLMHRLYTNMNSDTFIIRIQHSHINLSKSVLMCNSKELILVLYNTYRWFRFLFFNCFIIFNNWDSLVQSAYLLLLLKVILRFAKWINSIKSSDEPLIIYFQKSEELVIPKQRLATELPHIVFKDLDTFVHDFCLISSQSMSEDLIVQLRSISLKFIDYVSCQTKEIIQRFFQNELTIMYSKRCIRIFQIWFV